MPHKNFAQFEPNNRGCQDQDIEVRLARPEDAKAIAEVEVAAMGKYPDPFDEVVQKISGALVNQAAGDATAKTWVALKGEVVLGFSKVGLRGAAGQESELPHGWYLFGVTVHPEQRRIGVGHRLVQVRLDWLQEKTQKVYYFTEQDNLASQALHQHFGFEKVTEGIQAPTGYTPLAWQSNGLSVLFVRHW